MLFFNLFQDFFLVFCFPFLQQLGYFHLVQSIIATKDKTLEYYYLISEMTMGSLELPSINSTTSISDNPELKNYYEKLLFKNQSGNSLTDLPSKIFEEQGKVLDNNCAKKYTSDNKTFNGDASFNFISGFRKLDKHHSEDDCTYSIPLSNRNVGNSTEKPVDSNNTTLNSVSAYHSNDLKLNTTTVTTTTKQDLLEGPSSNSVGSSRRQSIFKQFLSQNSNILNHDQVSIEGSSTVDPLSTNCLPIIQQDNSLLNSFNFPINNIDKGNVLVASNNSSSGMPHENSNGYNEVSPLQSLYSVERRSSYISDSLIHNNTSDGISNFSNRANGIQRAFYRNNSIANNNINNVHEDTKPLHSYNFGSNFNPLQQSYETKNLNSNFNYLNFDRNNSVILGSKIIEDDYNNTSFGMSHGITTTNAILANRINETSHQRYHAAANILAGHGSEFDGLDVDKNHYGYLNYISAQFNKKNHSDSSKNSNINNKKSNPVLYSGNSTLNNCDNGLVMTSEKRLVSSEELRKIYHDSAINYFSSRKVFDFIDNIKRVLENGKTTVSAKIASSNHSTDSIKNNTNVSSVTYNSKKLLQFLSFLKSCNLNYNPKSDAFISSLNKEKRFFTDMSSFLHYKPLVLVSLKNGKLELLSLPQNSNLSMKRDDLIIIDGDRGKDLALVIEPSIDLNMALIINFLKKKIHFDSLITSREQHYPNARFIDALMNSTKGLTDELNPKLYDVIELIQLVVPSKQVLRFATAWEVTTNLHNKFQDELKALHIAQLKLKSLNSGLISSPNANALLDKDVLAYKSTNNGASPRRLNIKILNAEFQFDRKKLTFYYICQERNDFRDLIKELFKYYKTRIWLCAIPNNLNIDEKYYTENQNELKMYQDMMSHYAMDEVNGLNNFQSGFLVAPALNKLKLDDFQIGVYQELVRELFQ